MGRPKGTERCRKEGTRPAAGSEQLGRPESTEHEEKEPSRITEARRIMAKAREKACSATDVAGGTNKGRGQPKGDPRDILISDDEHKEEDEDDIDVSELWDDLVKNNPERWDLRDALRLGRSQGGKDPSEEKQIRQRETTEAEIPKASNQTGARENKVHTEARAWDGHDLHAAVEQGTLSKDQATSIMKLRSAIGKGKAEGNQQATREAEVGTKTAEIREVKVGTKTAEMEETEVGTKTAEKKEVEVSTKPPEDQKQQEYIKMETSNATSLNTNRETALKRTAHFQAMQEACLNEAQNIAMRTAAQ